MHPTLRAGIIGLSWIGADPAGAASWLPLGTAPPYSHASAMEAVGNIDVVAVCDIDPDARQGFLDLWQHLWPGVRPFEEVDQMLATPLDLVSVVTPDHLHAAMIDKCIDAGVKMVFSEKPFTTSLAGADRLLDRIRLSSTTVSINHTWRWRPDVAEALGIIGRAELGPLSHITIEAGGPRAMLFRNLSHFIDLAVHLAMEHPEWVIAELEGEGGDYGLGYRGEGGSDPALDPGASILIGFPDGVRAYVTGLKASLPDVSVQVLCRDGRVSIDGLGARTTTVPRTTDGTPASVGGPAIRPLRPRFTASGMEAGLADLIESFRRGAEPSGSARSARATVAVIDAALRSHAAGSARVEVAPPPAS